MKNAGMKKSGTNSGEALEKVLAGLRDAEAPDGMERRILAGLEERAAVRSRSGWRQWLPVWLVAPARPVAAGSLVCGVVLAGIFVVGFALPVIRRLGHAPVQAPQQAGRSSVPVRRAWAASKAAGESARSALLGAGVGIAKKRAEWNAGGVAEIVRDRDSVAEEEMHAASYPAPPMPLTEQERLLLRLVHKDDPVELAMLDPKLRDLEDLADKAEFQSFFGQATKPPVPEQPVTEQAAPEPSTTDQVTPTQSATEQATPAQPGAEPSVPEQPAAEQPVPEEPAPEKPTQPQAVPEKVAPDQSRTQQVKPGSARTGENE